MKWQLAKRFLPLIGRAALIAGALGVLLLTIAWLSGMFEEKVAPGWEPRGLTQLADQPTDAVHEVRKAYTEEAVGTLKASSRTIVAAKVLATIDDILVAAGDEVTTGQVLVKLDDKEYQTRLDQAKRSLEGAMASRAQALSHFERIESLIRQGAASEADFDKANADLLVATAEASRAQQAVSEAEVLLSYTTITATKNGRIVDRLAEPGDIAKPGEPLLVLYDAASLRLEAPVKEQLAVKLQPGDPLTVYVDALNRELDASIDEIVPQADAPSRSFLVKASVPKSPDLYEGMFGRLRIPAGERRHLCLASEAIVRVGQLEFVDVVLPDGTIERRLIHSGQLGMPGRQEVLSGLQAGERVVLHSDPKS